MHLLVGVLDTKDDHSGLIKVIGSKLLEVLVALDVEKGGTDGVVDHVTLTQTEVNVGTGVSQNGGEEGTACDQLQVDGDVGVGGEVVVDEVTVDLRLVTGRSQPDLGCGLIGLLQSTHAVVVTEEGLPEALDLMDEGLEEVGGCGGHLLAGGLDLDVVQLQRLSLGVGEEGTQRTDVGLEVGQVLCHLVVVGTHLLQQTGDLFQGSHVGGLLTCDEGQLIGQVVEVTGLDDHVDHNVGHDLREAVVAVLVRGDTGQLDDVQVVAVDRVQDVGHAADHVAHLTEGDLEADGVDHVGLQVDLEGLLLILLIDLTVAVGVSLTGGQGGDLPLSGVIVSKLQSLLEGSAVVVALSTLCQALAEEVHGAAGGHTVQHVLTEAGDDVVHTGGGDLEAVLHPLTCGCPLVTADGVQNGAGGIGGRVDRAGAVLHGVDGLVGHDVGQLGLDLDGVLTCGHTCVLSDVGLVGVDLLDRVQSDRLDGHGLVLALEGDLVLTGGQSELEVGGVVAAGILQIISHPLGHVGGGGSDLVLGDVALEEADAVCIGKLRHLLGDEIGEADLDRAVLDADVGVADCLSLGRNGLRGLALTGGQGSVNVVVDPTLGKGEEASLSEGNLIVDLQSTLDGSGAILVGVVLESDRVLSGLGDGYSPGNLAVGGGEQRGDAVLGLHLEAVILGDELLDVHLNGLGSAGHRGVLLGILFVGDCIQKLTKLIQRNVGDGVSGAIGIRSGSEDDRIAQNHGQAKQEGRYPCKFLFPHYTFPPVWIFN